MRLAPWTTLSLVISGDDLAVATVSGGWGRAMAQPGPTLRSFLTLAPEEAARAVGHVPPGARLILTCPSNWVGLRPAAIGVEQWGSARDSIQKSIESFFPLSADDAMVGMVRRVGVGAGAAGGYLLAASRARLKPWLEAIQRSFGRPVDAVLTPHVALLGLGLQGREQALVTERGPGASKQAHRLRYGEIEELAGAHDEDATTPAALHWAAPGEESSRAGGTVNAAEQAVAAALAERIAPKSFAPLQGRSPMAAPRWALPAAGIAVALILLWGAAAISDARYEGAIARLDQKEAALADPLKAVRATRDDAIRLDRVLRDLGAKRPGGRPGVLAEISPALAVIPKDGVLYAVQFDGTAVTLRGEARRASDVLQRLEETPEYQAARQLDTAVPVEERGTEQFHIRAERAGTAPKMPARTGEPAR